MPVFVFFLFVAVPLVEIALFIEVGGLIGLWPTLLVVVLTAFAGTSLLRAQGLATFARARASLDRGQVPMVEVMHGFFLVIAGALLLTPGFLTDAIGLALFVPAVRRRLGRTIGKWLGAHAKMQVYAHTEDRRASAPTIDITADAAPDAAPDAAKDVDNDDAPQNPPPGSPGSPWRPPS